MKRLLLIGLISLPALACVDRDEQGYIVRDGSAVARVKAYDMDKSLAKYEPYMNPAMYNKCVEAGLKVKASRLSDGSYYLHDNSGLNGGGPVLAFIGAGVVGVVGVVGTAATAYICKARPPLAAAASVGGGYTTKAAVAGTFAFLAGLPTP